MQLINWFLNGAHLGEFKGLSEVNIKSLEFIGEINGVRIFKSNKLPKGTLELWGKTERLAVITGLGEPNASS